ncbi:MAG: ELWxxDGT repeat protein [Cyanobium sp.]
MTVVNTAAGQRFFFSADDGVGGNDLWVSDGTTLGTKVVLDMISGENNFSTPTQASGQLFFMLNQQQLWSSNGTPEGTTIQWGFSGFGNNILDVIDDKIFIESVDFGGNKQLWAYSNAAKSAQQLTTFDNNPSELTFESERATLGKNFFFSAASTSHGTELWVTDGTTVGTRLVKDIRSGSAGSNPRGFIAARGRLYFWADDGANGVELWRSDGTAGGTSIVADLKPGPEGSIAEMGFFDDSSKVVGDKLLFRADDGTSGPELWALTLPDPSPPTLALSALSASKAEGRAGATPFTFQVTRSGNSTGLASVRWVVSGGSTTPASASDFASSAFPSGTVSFAAGQTRQTITVNVAGDLGKETDETFRVTLSGATGATITTATANGTILNDDLIGDGNRNRLVGTARAEFIDGRANLDTLTGGAAADVFGFRFGESRLSTPDAITDFAFGTDKIDLFAASGGTLPAPARFSRAANNGSAKTLAALSAAVFTDANGAQAGKQALAANGAVLVRATHAAIAGTYLVINNSVAGRSDSDDLMIKLNGFTGPLPAIGTVGVGTVFV